MINTTYDIIYLSDSQDLWLFNYFIENKRTENYELVIIYETTGKVTSGHALIGYLKKIGINPALLLSKNKITTEKFDELIKKCRWFITKDFLPFKSSPKYPEKIIALSWVGESLNRTRKKNYEKIVHPGYKKIYAEKSISKVYEHLGHQCISTSPKYYFLKNNNRESICKILNLDPGKKYVTVFSNVFFDTNGAGGIGRDSTLSPRTSEIYKNIVEHCKKNDINIILKNKMKYGDAFKNSVSHDMFHAGAISLYHPGISLMAISEFSVGLATSAAVEAEEIGSRFISFWKDDYLKVDSNLYEKIVGGSLSTYRLAQEKNTYMINTQDNLSDIIDGMGIFMKNSSPVIDYNIEIDDFIKQEFGEPRNG